MNIIDDGVTIPLEVSRAINLDDKTAVEAWREHLGLTQEEVAKRLGITQSAYGQIEQREGGLRDSIRQRLAEAFGIGPEQLRL